MIDRDEGLIIAELDVLLAVDTLDAEEKHLRADVGGPIEPAVAVGVRIVLVRSEDALEEVRQVVAVGIQQILCIGFRRIGLALIDFPIVVQIFERGRNSVTVGIGWAEVLVDIIRGLVTVLVGLLNSGFWKLRVSGVDFDEQPCTVETESARS